MSTGAPSGNVTTLPSGICTASQARFNMSDVSSMMLGFRRKPENNSVPINVPGRERGGGKFRMVGRIREMLRFQAKAGTLLIDLPAFAFDRSVKMIAGVELHTRLCRQNFQHPARGWLARARDNIQMTRRMIEDKIVIIA